MERTACYSLSGYLSLKPCGALSLVLPTRRYWCAFNESIRTLEFYQSERDLTNSKTPIESLSLYRAAITLSTTEERVFIILTNNKEHHLRAENHEALMIWLLGLQSKRDSCISSNNGSSVHGIHSGLDTDEIINNEDVWNMHEPDSLTPTEFIHPRMFITERTNPNDFPSDDEKYRPSIMIESMNRKLSTQSIAGLQLCHGCSLSLCSHCRSAWSRSSDLVNESIPNRTSSSSYSIESSDSAFCDQRLLDVNDGLHQNNIQETLLTLKCELASLINKENIYQLIIKEKSNAIRTLEKQLSDVAQSATSSSKQQTISKVFNERSRETNNELKFLHCEIARLHGILRDDDIKMRKLLKTIRSQQTQRESLQRDYIYLLQTTLSSEYGRLYGGTKHRDRLKELLAECRKRDPSLPSFESMDGSGLYIDPYGFKREKNNLNDRLQYICVKLTHFYDSKAHSTDESSWRSLIKLYQNSSTVSKTLKYLVRQGIPDHLRTEIWHIFIQKQTSHIRKEKGALYYQNLCHLLPNSDLNSKFEKQIALDLHRTMPSNIRFANRESEGIRHLRQVLQVFCLHNPAIGYCQGMNFIVAVALLLVEPEDAFWLLIAITECHLNNYYDVGLIGAQVDQFVLKDLLKQKAPDIDQHFEINEVEITSLTLNWFMAIFIDTVPFETLLRIWDCFLLEGSKVLFRFALSILIINRESILTKSDTISMMKQIKDSTKNLIDVENLFKIAFEDLKPFCHRKDIHIKQAYWTKMLTDKVLKRQLSKEGFSKRDFVFEEINSSSSSTSTTTTLDCAVVLPGNLVWIAFGSQYSLHIFEVNVERGIMMDIEVTYNSRAFCMACVNSELVLIGTLCGTLLGFSIDDRQILWATRLRSCLLCMTSLNKTNCNRIYCGLSCGNLAIVELYEQREPEEAFCITIDKSALTAVAYRNDKLWCLSSNKMTIVNEKTLDILASIDLTFESLDPACLLYYDHEDSDHIWILLRSTSNVLQAWNQSECKLHGTISLNHLFEKIGKTDEQLAMMEEGAHLGSIDDGSSSNITDQIRITSFLVHDEQLWIGTSTGIIFVLNFSFQQKTIRSSSICSMHKRYVPRSASITTHLINGATRNYIAVLPNIVNNRQKSRSQSESAMVEILNSSDDYWNMDHPSNCHLYRIAFQNKAQNRSTYLCRRRQRHNSTLDYVTIVNENKRRTVDSDASSTTLTSTKAQTSSPAVISSDEWCQEPQQIKLPSATIKQPKSLEASATLSFNLLFKAKIADAPVKCICKTKCNGQFLILTCSGKLGDDEVVCRWRRVPDTNQWTNDVIVELSPETMLPIRPAYARQKYLKDQRDRSVSISSSTSRL
ncbi:unnamed protein product [Rotaria socialis]|uniref:TBC1 domain family member 2B n=1 Tax=Rotaria socialis TaxID=392032 RepID=A0A817QRD8_9BILA|nr:unnamed protein product [Rotaria socialis]CAF3501629.1 unnamed protein product [Rotaria socialis]CAF4119206.1 unnamed protein product [Rotaria socialis]CAF4639830.1 unnamed protein product [Rotaria socialis]